MQFFLSISQQPLGTSVAQQIARAAGARAAPPPSMRVKPDFHAYWIMKIVFKLMFEKNKCQQNGFWFVFPLNKPSHQYNHYDKYHQSLVTSLLPGPSRCLDNWVCAMRPQIRLELFPQLPSGESTPDTPNQLVHPIIYIIYI